MAKLRVQFAHGLEGSPQGTKARLLSANFDARTPAMDTSDFEACVAVHRHELASFRPDVLVGSSYGGAIAVALLQSGEWSGPTLLLAQAALQLGLPAELPRNAAVGPVWLVHGHRDDVIDPEDSRRLAAAGPASRVRLIEVDDDHPLNESVASGKLLEWVRALGRAADAPQYLAHKIRE